MNDPPGHPSPTDALDTDSDLKLALAEYHRRISEHTAARQAADHLTAAACLLRQVPGREAILLGAPGAADVLTSLRHAAPFDGAVAMLPSFDLRNAIYGLRSWPSRLDNHSPERPRPIRTSPRID